MEEKKQHPWAKRPEESAKQYAAFVLYLDAGSGRSAAKIAPAAGYSVVQAERLCAQHAWTFRADQHDAWRATQMVDAREVAAKAEAEDAAMKLSTSVSKMIDIGLEFMKRTEKRLLNEPKWVPGPSTVREWQSDSLRLQRILAGQEKTPEEREQQFSEAVEEFSAIVRKRGQSITEEKK